MLPLSVFLFLFPLNYWQSCLVPFYLPSVSVSINSEDRLSWTPQTRRCPLNSMKGSVCSFSDDVGIEVGFIWYLLAFLSSHIKRRSGMVDLTQLAKCCKSFPKPCWGKCQRTEVLLHFSVLHHQPYLVLFWHCHVHSREARGKVLSGQCGSRGSEEAQQWCVYMCRTAQLSGWPATLWN